MNPIRPHDLVRLRQRPECPGVVLCTEADLAFVELSMQAGGAKVLCWVPLDLLELVPGQFERLAA